MHEKMLKSKIRHPPVAMLQSGSESEAEPKITKQKSIIKPPGKATLKSNVVVVQSKKVRVSN